MDDSITLEGHGHRRVLVMWLECDRCEPRETSSSPADARCDFSTIEKCLKITQMLPRLSVRPKVTQMLNRPSVSPKLTQVLPRPLISPKVTQMLLKPSMSPKVTQMLPRPSLSSNFIDFDQEEHWRHRDRRSGKSHTTATL